MEMFKQFRRANGGVKNQQHPYVERKVSCYHVVLNKDNRSSVLYCVISVFPAGASVPATLVACCLCHGIVINTCRQQLLAGERRAAVFLSEQLTFSEDKES